MSNSMNLPIPTVGTTPGPEYADNINTSLTLIAEHDHTTGKGVPISTAGLNIDGPLPFNNHSAISLKAATFQTQAIDGDSRSIYVKGTNNDLWYNNGTSAIQITNISGVAGSPGNISNLISPASAVYNGGTFSFFSNGTQPADLKGASIYLGNASATTNYLNLQPPAAMASNYALVLPTIPAQTNVMTLDAAGNMSSITYNAVGQGMTATGANAVLASVTSVNSTQADLIANKVQMPVGSSLGNYAAGPEIFPAVTFNAPVGVFTVYPGLTASLTVSGLRPIMVRLEFLCPSDPTISFGTPNFPVPPGNGITGAPSYVRLIRNGTPIYSFAATTLLNFTLYSGWVDLTPTAAGAVTYTVDAYNNSTSLFSSFMNRIRLVAYEL